MSATIPETMLLSDLLKPTGYDCPQDLQGKTFDQSTSGGGDVVLENNKEVSITENGTIEITPSAGKDAMKKVTALVNISGGSGVMPLRFFDGRNSGYTGNPKGFWVINAAQSTGKACCLVTAPGSDPNPTQASCIQTIQSLTGNRLSVDEWGRESFEEVTAAVVAAAILAL